MAACVQRCHRLKSRHGTIETTEQSGVTLLGKKTKKTKQNTTNNVTVFYLDSIFDSPAMANKLLSVWAPPSQRVSFSCAFGVTHHIFVRVVLDCWLCDTQKNRCQEFPVC